MEILAKHLKRDEKSFNKFLKLWGSIHPNSKI